MTPAELASALAELGFPLPWVAKGGIVLSRRETVFTASREGLLGFIGSGDLATLIAQAVNTAGGMEET